MLFSQWMFNICQGGMWLTFYSWFYYFKQIHIECNKLRKKLLLLHYDNLIFLFWSIFLSSMNFPIILYCSCFAFSLILKHWLNLILWHFQLKFQCVYTIFNILADLNWPALFEPWMLRDIFCWLKHPWRAES